MVDLVVDNNIPDKKVDGALNGNVNESGKKKKGKKSKEFRVGSVKNYSKIGHILQKDEFRSDDVTNDGSDTFDDFHINDLVLKGLQTAGFNKPSPVQNKVSN